LTFHSQRRLGQRLSSIALAVVMTAPSVAEAERLPVRIYTTDDGLAHDRVGCVRRDSRGFLWFCTAAGGLSRFDGTRFVNSRGAAEFSRHTINDILEDGDGWYWIATNGSGVYRLDVRPGTHGAETPPRLAAIAIGTEPATNRVNVLFRDHSGEVWAGTDAGLFVLDGRAGSPSFRPIPTEPVGERETTLQIWSFAEGGDQSLWIGTSDGLRVRTADGDVVRIAIDRHHGAANVWAILRTPDERFWIASQRGLIHISRRDHEPRSGGPLSLAATRSSDEGGYQPLSRLGTVRSYPAEDGWVFRDGGALLLTEDGHLWIGSSNGLMEFDGERFRAYTHDDRLATTIRSLVQDIDGNIWAATDRGALRIARHGFVTYTEADGLADRRIGAIFESRSGELCVMTANRVLNVFDGQRFRAIRMGRPDGVGGVHAQGLQDQTGDWWVSAGDRLMRFPAVSPLERLSDAAPTAIYSSRDGLPPEGEPWRLFEDSRGDLWVATRARTQEMVSRWDRRTGVFQRYSDRDGLPTASTVTSFAEDRAGNVWVGFWDGGLARFRGGRFTLWSDTDTTVWGGTFIHIDRAGRLWASSNSGLRRIDDPTVDRPELVESPLPFLEDQYATPLGEDGAGGLYFRYSQGVLRLDPATSQVMQYTTAAGLAHLEPSAVFRARDGRVWFATSEGLSRLAPQARPPAAAPTVAISGVRIGGAAHPVPDIGTIDVAGLQLPSDRRQLEVEFFAIGFRIGDPIHYEYKLEGADSDWSRRTDQRVVTYAQLAPGSYRFVVRAITGAGTVSPRLATVSFTVLAPIWQRTWFVGLVAGLFVVVAYLGVQYRTRRLLELERIRTRIATDLHDDIGASLSQIAILSEVVRRRAGPGEAVITEPLSQIAGTARELVDGMSDIVWAIDPQKDHVASLATRMRRHGSDVLPASDIGFDFLVLGDEGDRWIGAETRRQVFLVFKEAINNIVRHARATAVRVEFGVAAGVVRLLIEDNGQGFDPAADVDGHGLRSLRDRARRLGGTVTIQSTVGSGSVVTLTCPLAGPPHKQVGDPVGTRS
jgi:signal transduction histidine kinase/ligand-binding sensor domain-containing protein